MILSLGDGLGLGVPTTGQKGLGLLCVGMEESSSRAVDALLGCSLDAVLDALRIVSRSCNNIARCSQPSGDVHYS